jgi:hypothetical protein
MKGTARDPKVFKHLMPRQSATLPQARTAMGSSGQPSLDLTQSSY